jgi:chaperone modulatory protein CbpM
MINADAQLVRVPVVAEEIHLTLFELCQACHVSEDYVIAWVCEGALEAVGDSPPDWRFTGASLRRAKLALWLSRDLEINPPGVALALDLLDEIAALQGRLKRLGVS